LTPPRTSSNNTNTAYRLFYPQTPPVLIRNTACFDPQHHLFLSAAYSRQHSAAECSALVTV
jgi:hypothetical protein